MMFTVANLLDQLTQKDSLDSKKLEKILKLTKKADRSNLSIVLSALGRLGIISTDENGIIDKVIDENLIEARLRCSSKGYCFALRNDGAEDIYIRDQNLNHGWNGDRVLVRITREGVRRRSPEGAVQCILERANNNILGLIEKEDGIIYANPLDDRILSSIKLPPADKSYLDEKVDNLVEIQIDRYPIAQFQAEGHVVRPLTLNGGPSGDRDLLLTKANLQNESSPPRSALKTPNPKNRKDLTNQPTLLLRSWESQNSPCLPAVHIEPNNGGFRFWIHVPAIAERITLGNNLDLWLQDRVESHCLGNAWQSFLSDALHKASEFTVGEISEAVSLSIDIGSEGQVNDWEFSLSLIKPTTLISPKDLTALSNRKPKSRTIPLALKHIKDHIVQLQSLIYCAKTLNSKEKELGVIELNLNLEGLNDLSDLSWEDPSTEWNQWILPLNINDPQSILRTFIRLANRIWYIHSKNFKLPGYLLTSDKPEITYLNEILRSTLSLDLKLELDDEGSSSAKELAEAFSKTDCPRILEKLLCHYLPNTYLINSLYKEHTQELDSEELTPDKIPVNIMAPWCSPTAHYYDLANQQIQIALLKDARTSANSRNKNKVNLGLMNSWKDIEWNLFVQSTNKNIIPNFTELQTQQLNNRRRQSILLRNSIIAMAQARLTEKLVGQELEAVISGVQSYGFFAEIPPSNAEGLVHVSTLNDDWYEYRSRQNRLVGRKNRKIYQLGDIVKIRILKVDVLRNQIDLEVRDSSSIKNSSDMEIKNKILEEDLIQIGITDE